MCMDGSLGSMAMLVVRYQYSFLSSSLVRATDHNHKGYVHFSSNGKTHQVTADLWYKLLRLCFFQKQVAATQ